MLLKGIYQLDRMLGQGGMARVYRAFDTSQSRWVAIKQIVFDASISEDFMRTLRERFLREYYFLSRINHSNVIRAYDFFEQEGHLFLVLEFAEGVLLSDLITKQKRKVSLLGQLGIACQICKGIEVLNSAGILHRDIKPENIMVSLNKGIVKILDLGIAKSTSEHDEGFGTLTQKDGKVGTPAYMSPEQIENDMKKNSDVFSVGVVLYQFFLWLPNSPFLGGSSVATLRNVVMQNLAPMCEHMDSNVCSKEFYKISRLVDKALTKDSSRRLPSMREFGNRLRDIYLSMQPNTSQGDAIFSGTIKQGSQWDIGEETLHDLTLIGKNFEQEHPQKPQKTVPKTVKNRRSTIKQRSRSSITTRSPQPTLSKKWLVVLAVVLVNAFLVGAMFAYMKSELTKLREGETALETTSLTPGKNRHTPETLQNFLKSNRKNAKGINLSFADLQKFNLSSSNLEFAKLNSANLQSANLSLANLKFADLSSANLTSTNLNSAKLEFANLNSANLTSADLSFANLESANFNKANLDFADLNSCLYLTPKQLSTCKSIKNIKGLSEKFLRELQILNPGLLQWWQDSAKVQLANNYRVGKNFDYSNNTPIENSNNIPTENSNMGFGVQGQTSKQLLDKAWDYHRRGLYSQAIEEYQKIIVIDVNNIYSYNNLGRCYTEQGKHDLALQNFNRALQINSGFYECYNSRAVLYEKMQKYDLALADYNRAIQLKSDYIYAYYNRGILYQKMQQYDQALSDYSKVLSTSANANIYFNRGGIFYIQGQYSAALQDFRKAAEMGMYDAQLQKYIEECERLTNQR